MSSQTVTVSKGILENDVRITYRQVKWDQREKQLPISQFTVERQ